MYSMRFIGPPDTFSFRLITRGVSIISEASAVNAAGTVFFPGNDGFYSYTSGTGVVPLESPVSKYVFDTLNRDQKEKVFGAVEIHGIFGSERYMSLKEEEQRLAKKILMLDPFELRRLVPRPLIRWLYAVAFKFVNMKTEEKQGEKGGDITVSDFSFSRDNVDNALDLICVCKP